MIELYKFKNARANAPTWTREAVADQPDSAWIPPRHRGGPLPGMGAAAYALLRLRNAAQAPRDGRARPAHYNAAPDCYGHALRRVGATAPDSRGPGRFQDYMPRRDAMGYYCNPWGESFIDGSGLAWGVVYQLPARRGVARFVVGVEFGGVDGGPNLDLSTVYEAPATYYESAEDLARESGAVGAANEAARIAAEAESEYQSAWRAGCIYAEAAEDLAAHRREALQILAERRGVAGVEAPALCHAIRAHVAALREAMAEARQRMAEAVAGDLSEAYFWPGDESLQNAFCDGAGLDSMPGGCQ